MCVRQCFLCNLNIEQLYQQLFLSIVFIVHNPCITYMYVNLLQNRGSSKMLKSGMGTNPNTSVLSQNADSVYGNHICIKTPASAYSTRLDHFYAEHKSGLYASNASFVQDGRQGSGQKPVSFPAGKPKWYVLVSSVIMLMRYNANRHCTTTLFLRRLYYSLCPLGKGRP